MHFRHRAAIAAALAALGFAASAVAQPTITPTPLITPARSGLTVSAGVGYTSGDYGAEERTEIFVAPLGIRYRTGSFRFLATIPYVHIDSPGTVFGGVEGGPIVVDPDTPMGRRVREGIGDLSLGATVSLPERMTGDFFVDAGIRVKLPTSDEDKELGTGKTDVSLSVDVSRQFGKFIPFVNVAYRFFGDPADWNLHDGFATSVGTSVQLGSNVLIASYDYTRAASRFIGDAHELFAGFSGPAGGRFSWTAFGTAGLSEGAPDYGVGLLFTLRLD